MLGIFGAGSFGIEVLSVLLQESVPLEELCFIDDVVETRAVQQIPVLRWREVLEQFTKADIEIVIALGEPKYRERVYNKIKENGYNLKKIVSKSAFVGPNAAIGEGTIVFPNAYVGINASVKDNTVVHFGAKLVEGVSLGKHCFVSLGAFVGSRTVVENTCFIGPNSAVGDNLTVGRGAVIGMGAVVLKPVLENTVNVGVPSKAIKNNESGIVFKKSE